MQYIRNQHFHVDTEELARIHKNEEYSIESEEKIHY